MTRRRPRREARGARGRRRATHAAAGLLLGAAAILAAAASGGCVTESVTTGDGLPRPAQPEPLRDPPTGLEPSAMVLLVGQGTRDADGDGYPDTFSVTAALRSSGSPVMIDAPGTFTFDLWREGTVNDPEAEPLATWTFGPEATAAARTRTLYGWGYQFVLSLAAVGVDDRMRTFPGDVRGRFTSTTGTTVRASEDVRPVRFGR